MWGWIVRIFVPIEPRIDVSAIRARLAEEHAQLDKEMAAVDRTLDRQVARIKALEDTIAAGQGRLK